MKKFVHKCLMTFLSLFITLSFIPTNRTVISAVEKDGLVNIAKYCDVTVPENEKAISNMFDGNTQTIWSPSSSAGWPATIVFKLPADNTKPVEKIELRFKVDNSSQENWNMDVKLGYYVNSVTDELIAKEVKGHMLKDAFVFEFDEPINISHAIVTMDNPKNGDSQAGFWPQIAEMGIFVADDDQQDELSNLAPNAVITSCGNGAGNSANLVDGNYNSLYVFYNGGISTINGEAWVQADLGRDMDVSSLEIAFEKLANDTNNFEFTYNIYGMKTTDTDWIKLVASATANRTDNNVNEHLLGIDGATVKYSKFKIVIESITSTGGDPWPAIAELKIFGKEEAIQDPDNLAWQKPTHTNTNNATSNKITDGSVTSSWSGAYYPGYVDIDLEKNYNISDIEIYLPTSGYSQYDIYTSMDGRDFTKLLSKTDTEITPADGDSYKIDVEARIVRVYINYQSSGSNAIINEVRVLGDTSDSPIQKTPVVEVENFADSKYDVDITDEMTISEVQGIISRQLGEQYLDWFDFSLGTNPNGNDYDYFALSERNGKIHIEGNDGVSLATGLNHYLKYYLNVHISQVGNQVKMPSEIVSLDDKTITRETKLPIRYAYNYCTLSYSMAFWGEKEWRNELDWLALNGVNAVLDATAQEEVWRRFLQEIGYTAQEAKDYISGPAYYAWSYMANMAGYGGPVHDSWFVDRTELARSNQLSMRKLGMQPILQGYSGMVPVDIETKDPSTKGNVIGQGSWCSFTRPSMLNATSQSFSDYAKLFYQVQKDVFGDVTDFYATDPYHEGGNPGGVSANVVGANVLDEMITADEKAVWVVQAWGSNPTTGLLQGVAPNKDHVLILDLYAEKLPRWESFNGKREFTDTPWVYCMLNNFGGRLGLHGHIENFVKEVPKAINSAKYMKGIGITPEASVNNPVLYDLFFETIWSEDADNVEAIDLDKWYKDYTTRRYGAESENAYQAMLILNETVYNPALNMKGQGAPESVVNARPATNINAASTWGNAIIDYDKEKLEKAARLLLEDYDLLKGSAGYQYDVANVLEQVLSNSAQEYHKAMVRAYEANDLEQFTAISTKFLNLIDMVDKVTGTQEYFLVGRWIEQAKGLASNADEFTKELYEFNARSLITTWGSINQANSGGLHDYSNRQWAGLTNDYYKPRWQLWIGERTKELMGENSKNYSSAEWFAMEWQWVNENNLYTTESNGLDLSELGENVLNNYTVDQVPKDPAADDSKDLATALMTVTSGSEQATSGSEGPASNLIDGNTSTIWHSSWNGTDRDNLWLNIHLSKPSTVDGMRYLPRQNGSNGIITGYVIEVSQDNGKTYHQVATGTWANSSAWKVVQFDVEDNATDVRLKAIASVTDSSAKNYASGAEIRLTAPQLQSDVDKTLLNEAIAFAETLNEADYTKESWAIFITVLDDAKQLVTKENVTQDEINSMVSSLENAKNTLVKIEVTEAHKSALIIAIDLAKKVTDKELDKLIPVVVNEFKTALTNAIKVYENTNANQDEVNQAFDHLAKAMHMLEFFKGDKTTLKAFIDQVSKLIASEYTETSWQIFTAALEIANEVYTNENAMQGEVDETYTSLVKAFLDLRLVPNKNKLEELINKAENYQATNYTVTTYTTLLEILNVAKTVYEDSNSTKEDIINAEVALAKAIANLIKNPNTTINNDSSIAKSKVSSAQTGDVANITGMISLLVISSLIINYKKRK